VKPNVCRSLVIASLLFPGAAFCELTHDEKNLEDCWNLIDRGQFKSALTVLKETSNTSEAQAEKQMMSGVVYGLIGDQKHSTACYRRAIKQSAAMSGNQSAKAKSTRAFILAKLAYADFIYGYDKNPSRKFQEAETLFDSAINDEPQSEEIAARYGNSLLLWGSYLDHTGAATAAQEKYDKAIELSRLNTKNSSRARATSAINAATAYRKKARLDYLSGRKNLSAKNFEQAMNALHNMSIAGDQNSSDRLAQAEAEVLLWRGRYPTNSDQSKNDYQSSIEKCDLLLARPLENRNYLCFDTKGQALDGIARIESQAKNFLTARQFYEKSIANYDLAISITPERKQFTQWRKQSSSELKHLNKFIKYTSALKPEY